MTLPTPECPRCHRVTEDRGSYFAWPMLAAAFEATMAARCAFRIRPELRG